MGVVFYWVVFPTVRGTYTCAATWGGDIVKGAMVSIVHWMLDCVYGAPHFHGAWCGDVVVGGCGGTVCVLDPKRAHYMHIPHVICTPENPKHTNPLPPQPKFVNFCPYQFLLLLAHTPATIVLAGKLGLARTIFKALAWQLCFSMGVVGAVVYIIDNKSRHSFIMSLEAAHARAAAAAAAAAVVGDGVDDVWDAGDGKAMASSPKKGGVYARKHA